MNPSEYERHVAELMRQEGWRATVVGGSHDGGVDVIAEREGRRMAVQVKMYGGSRPINAAMVRELHGAAKCADCDDAMIASDARVLADARVAATKLAVTLRHVPVPADIGRWPATTEHLSFADIWADHVTALNRRLSQYARFGAGEPVAHWGGRYIWQVARSNELLVAWHPVSWNEPARAYEKRLLAHFSHLHHGKRPFANLTG